MNPKTLTLSQTRPGMTVCICDLSKTDSLVCRRLVDLGINEGTEVCMKRKSPFGGPLTLEANGQLFGIRRHDAELIEVQIR